MKVYIENIVVEGGVVRTLTTRKKQRAFDSLDRISEIEIQSLEHAEKIYEAAKQIFDGYSKKRASPIARLQRKIVQFFFHLVKQKTPEEKKFQAIDLLYDQIIKDCNNYKGREAPTSAEDPPDVESVHPDDEGVHSDEEPFKLIMRKRVPSKSEPLDMGSIQDNFGVMGGEHILTKLKEEYKADPLNELQRLRDNGVLSEEVEDKLNTMCRGIRGFTNKVKDEIKVVYGRALEIQKHVGKTHFVLLHAQAVRWTLVAYLIKELVRHEYPKEEIEHFKFLRNPKAPEKKIDAFTGARELCDHDEDVRHDLLSCDGYLFNGNIGGESSFSFFQLNRSMLSITDTRLEEILEGLIPGKVALKNELNVLLQEKLNHPSVKGFLGTMHMILVPKKAIQNDSMGYIYRAHPGGQRCDCVALRDVDENKLITLMQQGVFHEEWKCKHGRETYIPQYRLLTSHLKPKKGIFFHTETPIPKADRKRIKKEFREVIEKHLG